MAKANAKKNGAKSAKVEKQRVDIYQNVTDRVITLLEGGHIPWACPWTGGSNGRGIVVKGGAVSHDTGKTYGFTNQMLCGFHGEWLTFKMVQEEAERQQNAARKAGTLVTREVTYTNDDGEKVTETVPDFHAYAHVRKGEKGTPIVFWKQTVIKEKNEDGEEETKVIPMLKQYTVFEVSQCEHVERKYPDEPMHVVEDALPDVVQDVASPIEAGEALVRLYETREAITINRAKKSKDAFYRPLMDDITVPCLAQYKKAKQAEYYSTLFHEIGHSTGHEKRLDRFSKRVGTAAFGSENYSKEELVAEMTSAMVLATLGIDTEGTLRNSAAYIENWLGALKNDKKMVVTAAGQAEKAVEYILFGKEGFIAPEEPAETENAAPVVETEAAESEDRDGVTNPAPVEDSVSQGEGADKPLTPFKHSYNIMLKAKRGYKPVSVEGYVFTTGTLRFGVTKSDSGEWKVSELTTGAYVNISDKTRKTAIERTVRASHEAEWADRLREAVSKAKEDANPDVNPKTVYAAAI